MNASLTSQDIDRLIETNDAAALDVLAARNGLTDARASKSHAALWHNIQLPQFARLASIVFGGQVAVLPNDSVYKQAQLLAKKAKAKVAISVEVAETPAGQTVYRIGDDVIVTC